MSDNEDFDSKESIKRLQDNFSQPDKFAQHLANTLAKSKDVDKAIRKIIIDLIKKSSNQTPYNPTRRARLAIYGKLY